MCSPLAYVVTSVTDSDGHVAAQADSLLSNRRASLSRSLTTDVSVGSPMEMNVRGPISMAPQEPWVTKPLAEPMLNWGTSLEEIRMNRERFLFSKWLDFVWVSLSWFRLHLWIAPHCMKVVQLTSSLLSSQSSSSATPNTSSPCVFVSWVNARQATFTDITLQTCVPFILALPLPLVPGILKSVTDLIRTWPSIHPSIHPSTHFEIQVLCNSNERVGSTR